MMSRPPSLHTHSLVALAWRVLAGRMLVWRMLVWRTAFVAVALVIAWTAGVWTAGVWAAGAQTSPSVVTELLRKGAAASAGRQYQTCVDAYSAAFALDPEHTTAGELGLCEEALGHFVEAHDHLLYALEG